MKEASPGKVLWVIPFYLLWILWIQHFVSREENLRAYKDFIVEGCRTSAAVARGEEPSGESFRDDCFSLAVKVDGSWGGGYARPSVRLKISSDGGQTWESRYLFVDIHPINGSARVRSETTEKNYYLNF